METLGTVMGIALRDGPRRMREVNEAHADVDGGLRGDHRVAPNRGITLISQVQWQQVCDELAAALPWHTRRANVLVDLPALGELIGRTIRIGAVRVEIKGETQPCGLMDELHDGLRAVLTPDYRAGVHGRVAAGGVIRVGELVVAE